MELTAVNNPQVKAAAELKLRAATNPHNTGNRGDFWFGYLVRGVI